MTNQQQAQRGLEASQVLDNPAYRAAMDALALTDGTAVGGTDYDNTTVTGDFAVTAGTGSVTISGSTVTVSAGVTAFTLTIGTTA